MLPVALKLNDFIAAGDEDSCYSVTVAEKKSRDFDVADRLII